MSKIMLLIISCLFSAASFSAEVAKACLKYQKEYGWSSGYSVDATVISGMELNSAVNSFSRFKGFSTYAVVFWDEGQASIFELPSMSLGQLPLFATQVSDQESRVWQISKNSGICF